jgi:hypothetical protein
LRKIVGVLRELPWEDECAVIPVCLRRFRPKTLP